MRKSDPPGCSWKGLFTALPCFKKVPITVDELAAEQSWTIVLR